MMKVSMSKTSEFNEFCNSAFAMFGDDVSKTWLAELFTGADNDVNRAINHLLDTPENKVVRSNGSSKISSVESKKLSLSSSGQKNSISVPKSSGIAMRSATTTSTKAGSNAFSSVQKKNTRSMLSAIPESPVYEPVKEPSYVIQPTSSRVEPIVINMPAAPAAKPEAPSSRNTALIQQQAEHDSKIQELQRQIEELKNQGEKLKVVQEKLEEGQKTEVASYDPAGNPRGRHSNAILQIGGKQDLIQMQIVRQQQMLDNFQNAILMQESRLEEKYNRDSENTNDEEWWTTPEKKFANKAIGSVPEIDLTPSYMNMLGLHNTTHQTTTPFVQQMQKNVNAPLQMQLMQQPQFQVVIPQQINQLQFQQQLQMNKEASLPLGSSSNVLPAEGNTGFTAHQDSMKLRQLQQMQHAMNMNMNSRNQNMNMNSNKYMNQQPNHMNMNNYSINNSNLMNQNFNMKMMNRMGNYHMTHSHNNNNLNNYMILDN